MTEEELFNEYQKSDCKSFTDFLINKIGELEKHNKELIALINAERERQEKCDDVHLRTIADLEKENAELKAIERMALYSKMSDQLTKATEIIKKLYAVYYDPCVTESDLKYRDELFAEINQFLSEVEQWKR